MLKNFKELKVWQKSYQLCLELYGIRKNFPNEEKYGLSSQMRSAAISIPSNIAEGYGRKTIPDKVLLERISEVERMLKALIQSLANKKQSVEPFI